MKCLYITNLGLLDNLAATQIVPYLQGIAGSGITVFILSYEKRAKTNDQKAVLELRQRLTNHGITWRALPYHNRWGNILDVLTGWYIVLGIVIRQKIDVIHVRSSIPLFIGWPLAKVTARKLIYDRRGTLAGDFVDDVNIKNLFSVGWMSRVLDRLDRFFIRRADATVVLTETMRERLLRELGIEVETIPCCVDLKRFGNPTAKAMFGGRFVVAYLGSLGTSYGLDEMADFFKEVRRERPDALFLIISHTDRGFIIPVLEKKNLRFEQDYVIMEATPDRVPALLAEADVSLMFYKRRWSDAGTSPVKFAESLAAGVPVAVNAGLGDTDELIKARRIGVSIRQFSGEAYRSAIGELKVLLGDAAGLDERCRATARDLFSLDKGIQKYITVYKSIMR
ncbi:MAG: glycosyltransferase [Candidatus Omnitrophica bacterium]|nr:glycosyltransferase [Candidatus Omnitrophota bacterium]